MIGMAIGRLRTSQHLFLLQCLEDMDLKKQIALFFRSQGLITSMNFLLSGISLKLTGSLRGVYMVFIATLIINIFLIKIISEHNFNKDFQVDERG